MSTRAYSCHGQAATAVGIGDVELVEVDQVRSPGKSDLQGAAELAAAPTIRVFCGAIGVTSSSIGVVRSFSEISASASGIGHGIATVGSARLSAG